MKARRARTGPDTSPRPRKPAAGAWWPLPIVVGVGLLLRLAWLLQARSVDPLFYAPQMDALFHHRWALAIVAGMEFMPGAFFRAPLYPYFLGLLYRVFGPNLVMVRLVQAALGGLGCGLIWLLWRRVLRGVRNASRIAFIAGLVWAAWPLGLWFDGELLIPALLVPLLLLALVLFYRSIDTDRQWWLPGLALGVAALARPNALVVVVALAAWLVFRYRGRTGEKPQRHRADGGRFGPDAAGRGRAWSRAGVFVAAALLAVLPVTVRNAIAGDPVLIAWQGGTNLYIGNNPESDGTTAIVPGTRPDWWGGYNDVKRGAEQALGRELRGSEIDRYWQGRAVEFWRDEPLAALRLTGRKLLLLVSGYEVANNRDIYAAKRRTFINPVLFSTPYLKFPFGLLLPLVLAGVWLLRRRAGRLVPLYLYLGAYGLSFVPFFITARFRLPLVPVLVGLAVAGGFGLVRSRGRELAVGLALVAVGLVLGNADLAGTGRRVEGYHAPLADATGLLETGQPDRAAAVLDRALAQDSSLELLVLRVSVELARNRAPAAEAAGRAAVRFAPDDPRALGSLGNVLAQTGRQDEAERVFRRVLELDPGMVAAWLNLGNIALAGGRLDEARDCYERALAISPAHAPALYHLGLAEYYAGRPEEAHRRWRQVLQLDPDHAGARRALSELR